MTIERLIERANEISECFTHFANLLKDREGVTKLEDTGDVVAEIQAVRRYCTHQRNTRDEAEDRLYFDSQIVEIDTLLLPLLGGRLA